MFRESRICARCGHFLIPGYNFCEKCDEQFQKSMPGPSGQVVAFPNPSAYGDDGWDLASMAESEMLQAA